MPVRTIAAVLAVAALAGAGGANAGFPASHERLLYLREAAFGPEVVAATEAGTTIGRVDVIPTVGLNGEVAVSPSGTHLAVVSTVTFPIPLDELPPAVRKKLKAQPPSQLGFAPFAIRHELGGSFSVLYAEAGLRTFAAYGRPAWSPDERHVAVASGKPGSLDLYLVAVDGRRGVDLTPNSPGDDRNPRFSPDGRQVVFESNRDGNPEIYVANADGSAPRNLTQSPARDTWPDWSPDGTQIVYTSNATGTDQLYVVPAAGGTPTRITHDAGNDRRAAWSPDGRWIAFSSDRDGEDDVFLVDPAGTTERRVTANASEDLVLDWQPLHDVVPPRVHAYPVQIAPRRAPTVRFRVSDDSGRARVEIELDTPHLSAGDSVEVTHVRAPRTVSRVLRDFDTTAHEVRSGSYCVLASDPSGNASTKSCAAVRIVKR